MEDFVIFNINEMILGVNMLNVQKIIGLPKIAQVPNSQKYMEGVIDFDGNVIPVINLKKKFNLSHTSINDKSNVLIITDKNESFGIIVDVVDEIVQIDYSTIVKKIGNKYISGVVKIKDDIVSLLNIISIVND